MGRARPHRRLRLRLPPGVHHAPHLRAEPPLRTRHPLSHHSPQANRTTPEAWPGWRPEGAARAGEQCVHRHRFESLQHATRVVGDWIHFHNHQRPHQALGMKTPRQTYLLNRQSLSSFSLGRLCTKVSVSCP
ncbi:MAG: integrase core domain-containing protein [Candidatus Dormibacteraceae bacterium]